VARALEKNVWPKEYALRVMKHYIALYTELGAVVTAAATKAAVAKARTLASRVNELATSDVFSTPPSDEVVGPSPANSAH
jgi:hypothetical protein